MWPERSRNAIQIGQAAKRAGLTIDASRFYERRALLPKASRTMGRFRLYTEADLARLTFIKQMQGLGFSLDEIKQLQELRDLHKDDCRRVRSCLA
jgi:MerR family transcriptional regulator, copper efflux regulator